MNGNEWQWNPTKKWRDEIEEWMGMELNKANVFAFVKWNVFGPTASEINLLFSFLHLYWRGEKSETPQQPRKREEKIKRRAARPSEAKKTKEKFNFCFGLWAEQPPHANSNSISLNLLGCLAPLSLFSLLSAVSLSLFCWREERREQLKEKRKRREMANSTHAPPQQTNKIKLFNFLCFVVWWS